MSEFNYVWVLRFRIGSSRIVTKVYDDEQEALKHFEVLGGTLTKFQEVE